MHVEALKYTEESPLNVFALQYMFPLFKNLLFTYRNIKPFFPLTSFFHVSSLFINNAISINIQTSTFPVTYSFISFRFSELFKNTDISWMNITVTCCESYTPVNLKKASSQNGSFQLFTIGYDVKLWIFIYGFCYFEVISFRSHFVECFFFYHEVFCEMLLLHILR